MRDARAIPLTDSERERYARQIMIPRIGEEGQRRLKAATVFIAGLGGLGSISAQYMAAAGVGELIIVDHDRVSLSNLNRQLLHRTADLDWPKTESARKKLAALNPECRIRPIATAITADNAATLIAGTDLVLDATDNMATRLHLNRTAMSRGIPFIYGGIDGFDGMVSSFVPGETGCLACIFTDRVGKDRPAPGVLGPTAGMVASIQSLEVLKYFTGAGEMLKGRLLCIEGLSMGFREVKIEPNPDCPVCRELHHEP
jgi:adenylyltransferase/sulfurtransferase